MRKQPQAIPLDNTIYHLVMSNVLNKPFETPWPGHPRSMWDELEERTMNPSKALWEGFTFTQFKFSESQSVTLII